MIGVLRVKIKVVLISKPFQAPDKIFFDTDMIWNYLIMLHNYL